MNNMLQKESRLAQATALHGKLVEGRASFQTAGTTIEFAKASRGR